jgi:hypothetical protein
MVSTKRHLEAEVQETWPGNARSHALLGEQYKGRVSQMLRGVGGEALFFKQ